MRIPLYKRPTTIALMLLSALAFTACSKSKPGVPAKELVVVARVNGTPITEFEVEQAAKRSLGALAVESVQRAARDKLLESAIQSRAIALAADRELTADERFSLDKEAAIYREQLLVRHYIDRHHPAEPVTAQMVSEYYQAHPERFGGGTENQYELVGASRTPSPDERSKFVTKLRDPGSRTDWKAWAKDIADRGLPAVYSTGLMGDSVLHPKLRELLSGLEPNKPSAVVFVDGRPYVARVTGKQAKTPRPLEEVRASIVRTLTPVQLSAAVETTAAEVMKTTKVEIINGAGGASPPAASPTPVPPGSKK
jgi:hypothetical protein